MAQVEAGRIRYIIIFVPAIINTLIIIGLLLLSLFSYGNLNILSQSFYQPFWDYSGYVLYLSFITLFLSFLIRGNKFLKWYSIISSVFALLIYIAIIGRFNPY